MGITKWELLHAAKWEWKLVFKNSIAQQSEKSMHMEGNLRWGRRAHVVWEVMG